VDLDAPEWSGDINNVTSVLKMWLRELPDPLLTAGLHQGFLEAASMFLPLTFIYQEYELIGCDIEIENDRLRHIRLHERVNELPDPNYATLKFFLGHLHRYVCRPPPISYHLFISFPVNEQDKCKCIS
jgi:Rho GTPase-activating protein RGD1